MGQFVTQLRRKVRVVPMFPIIVLVEMAELDRLLIGELRVVEFYSPIGTCCLIKFLAKDGDVT